MHKIWASIFREKAMILSFTAKNVRSIKDKVEFNLSSSPDTDHEENLISYGKEKYTRFVSVYGNNGSGKSSLLVSLHNLQSLVISNNVIQPGNSLSRMPHKLSTDEPTEYTISFVTDGIRYVYELSYLSDRVLKEKLSYAPKGRLAKIFDRNEVGVVYSPQFAFLSSLIENLMKKNKLLLSVAANNSKNEDILKAFLFIKEDLVICLGNKNYWVDYSARKMSENPAVKKRVIDFMNDNGINIEDIDVKQETVPLSVESIPQYLPESIRLQLLGTPSISLKIKLKHSGFWMDLNDESDGTQKLINFLCPIFDILETGKVFICDEAERHLHPLILRKIIKSFLTNRQSSAQFICTTHDIDLLDLSLLRRDQIWFTKLDPQEHKTKLYSLSSLKGVRKDENIKKNYLNDEY